MAKANENAKRAHIECVEGISARWRDSDERDPRLDRPAASFRGVAQVAGENVSTDLAGAPGQFAGSTDMRLLPSHELRRGAVKASETKTIWIINATAHVSAKQDCGRIDR